MDKPTVTAFNTIAPLIIQEYSSYLPSAFNEELTLLQKVNKIIQKMNELGEVTNDVVTQWNTVMEWVENDGLSQDVNTKLDQMASDGTLTSLISNDILGDKNNLTTTDKSNIVSAVNEINSKLAKQFVPKRYVFGGQLGKLKYELSNPLTQWLSIVGIGDSIMWGYQLSDSGASDPRDGTLSDPRAVYSSPNFFNLFKKYLGSKYMFNVVPILSNWSYSPSGQSNALFQRELILFPFNGDFTWATTGVMYTVPTAQQSDQSLTGMQVYTNIESGKDGVATLSFNFTGKEFTISYDSVANGMDYEVFVDGISKGVYHSYDGSVGYDRRQTISFGYVKNKLVEIKTVKTTYVGVQTLKLGGIVINKNVQIINNGIIGATTRSYLTNNINTATDGVAVGNEDAFVIMQLGTNDRIITAGVAKGTNQFKYNLLALINAIKANRDIILMCANPTSNENPSTYSFHMQDVRNIIYEVAKDNSYDMIDNFTIFGDADPNSFTVDTLHPNEYGHEIMYSNIINSLELN